MFSCMLSWAWNSQRILFPVALLNGYAVGHVNVSVQVTYFVKNLWVISYSLGESIKYWLGTWTKISTTHRLVLFNSMSNDISFIQLVCLRLGIQIGHKHIFSKTNLKGITSFNCKLIFYNENNFLWRRKIHINWIILFVHMCVYVSFSV